MWISYRNHAVSYTHLADVIAQAFKEFVKVNEKKQQRPSLRQKLKGLQKIIAQNKNKERSREKNKDRGQSL